MPGSAFARSNSCNAVISLIRSRVHLGFVNYHKMAVMIIVKSYLLQLKLFRMFLHKCATLYYPIYGTKVQHGTELDTSKILRKLDLSQRLKLY